MSIKKKIILSLNFIGIILVCIGNYFYLSRGGMRLQAFCSMLFVLIGALNFLYALSERDKNKKYNLMILLGLVCSFLADMTIAGNFITGVLFFAAGHISFLAAYCSIEKLVKIDIIISVIVVITGGTIILVSPFLEVPDEVMQVAGLIYACIISVMTGKAISNYIRVRNFLTQIACIGSILFFMSDIMLVFDWFLGMGSLAWVFCIGMYYPAQTLIAFSSFLCVGCDVTRDEDECECYE